MHPIAQVRPGSIASSRWSILAAVTAAMIALTAFLSPTAVLAGDTGVALTSNVFVERLGLDANGRQTVLLEAPVTVTRGDRLVFIVNYRNVGARSRSQLVITNPLPRPVAFQGSADQDALVSVDNGRNWGLLRTLRVRDLDGTIRDARPEDVTHVRWTLNRTVPAGASGRVSFRGVVR